MFNTLSEFYKSKKWQQLLAQLKQERLNEDGQIICEYCGKPIVRAYDIIGHHKEHLTEENVNDFNISLNPDNISFVHHSCHQRIHDKFGHSMREVYLVYGSPFAGKHEWVLENMSAGDLIIDIDSIWMCVSGLPRYQKPNRLKAVVFKVRDLLIDSAKYRNAKWNNCYLIGGFVLQSERERLCKELGAREIFIDTPMDECIARMTALNLPDPEEHERYIREWFERYTLPVSS